MEIQVVKERGYYRADCLDLSGCPPNGFGATAVHAICHLFYRLITEQRGGSTNEKGIGLLVKPLKSLKLILMANNIDGLINL